MGREENKVAKKHKGANIILTIIQIIIVIVAITVSAILIANPNVQKTKTVGSFPVKLLPVLTDSMSGDQKDSFNAGDLLVSLNPKDVNLLAVGDIVTFVGSVGGESALITHRIIEVGEKLEDGTLVYKTKGDAASSTSVEEIKSTEILAVYAFHIPMVGEYIFNLQQRPDLFLLVVVLPLAILFIWNIILFVKMIADAKAQKKTQAVIESVTEQFALTQIDEEEIKRRAIEEYIRSQNGEATKSDDDNTSNKNEPTIESPSIALEKPENTEASDQPSSTLTSDSYEVTHVVYDSPSFKTNQLKDEPLATSIDNSSVENLPISEPSVDLKPTLDDIATNISIPYGMTLSASLEGQEPSEDEASDDESQADDAIIEEYEGIISGGSEPATDAELPNIDLLKDNKVFAKGITSIDDMIEDIKEKLSTIEEKTNIALSKFDSETIETSDESESLDIENSTPADVADTNEESVATIEVEADAPVEEKKVVKKAVSTTKPKAPAKTSAKSTAKSTTKAATPAKKAATPAKKAAATKSGATAKKTTATKSTAKKATTTKSTTAKKPVASAKTPVKKTPAQSKAKK